MVRGHLGSTLGIVFGALLAFSAFAPNETNSAPGVKINTLFAGFVIVGVIAVDGALGFGIFGIRFFAILVSILMIFVLIVV